MRRGIHVRVLALLTGFLLGLSLAAPPGPVTALMADSALRRGPAAGVGVGLGATTADALFLAVAWLGAIAFLARYPLALALVSLLGAVVLVYYAVGAWRAARAPSGERPTTAATFATGFVAAITSPFNFAWWVGPGSVLIASLGALLVLGLFLGILAWVLFFPNALARLGRRVVALQRWVSYVSALVLLGFALWIGGRGILMVTAAL